MDVDDKNITPPNHGRNYRTDENLSQNDVAFLLDIKNAGRISEWENGMSNPGMEHLISLSLIYHRLESQIYYDLRKKLSEKLEARKKLLLEMKEKKRLRNESG